ncbi:MAG: type II toxin-antitoxin system HicB family antitoxin [Candidatus Hydrogenedentes bacterium]|nr:type II toxin-antitoxin system HicB family antitoxin [Candidatus Hydrogenedentota bacterium]
MQYAVVVEPSENGYGAYVPDLPGCVALGDTVDETLRLVQEAIELHLDGMREDGEQIPKPKTVCEYVVVE